MIMALRPDWVDPDGLATVSDMSAENTGLDVDLAGAVVQTYGAWGAGPGPTDNPAAATPELGKALLEILVGEVARVLRDFGQIPGPVED